MKITAQHRNWLLGGISLYALARSLAANEAERADAAKGSSQRSRPVLKRTPVRRPSAARTKR